MLEIPPYEKIHLSRNDILNDKTISWIIKYDLLECETVYELIVPNNLEFTHLSEEIRYMRKFNKKYQPIKKYIFNLHTNRFFFTIKNLDMKEF